MSNLKQISEAPLTLAGEINKKADNMLTDIISEYQPNGKVSQDQFDVMVQSCRKLMEITADIRAREIINH